MNRQHRCIIQPPHSEGRIIKQTNKDTFSNKYSKIHCYNVRCMQKSCQTKTYFQINTVKDIVIMLDACRNKAANIITRESIYTNTGLTEHRKCNLRSRLNKETVASRLSTDMVHSQHGGVHGINRCPEMPIDWCSCIQYQNEVKSFVVSYNRAMMGLA